MGIIFGVWTVAFVIKLIIALVGNKIYNYYADDNSFTESILIVVLCLVTEVIPYIATLDRTFINILQTDY